MESHSGIIESFSSDGYERCISTGSEPFSLLICLGATKFVLLSVFTLIETICPQICSKSRLKSAKSLLPVDVRRSKNVAAQGSPENGDRKWNLFTSHKGNFQHHFVCLFFASSKLRACVTCDGAIISMEPTPFLASNADVLRGSSRFSAILL